MWDEEDGNDKHDSHCDSNVLKGVGQNGYGLVEVYKGLVEYRNVRVVEGLGETTRFEHHLFGLLKPSGLDVEPRRDNLGAFIVELNVQVEDIGAVHPQELIAQGLHKVPLVSDFPGRVLQELQVSTEPAMGLVIHEILVVILERLQDAEDLLLSLLAVVLERLGDDDADGRSVLIEQLVLGVIVVGQVRARVGQLGETHTSPQMSTPPQGDSQVGSVYNEHDRLSPGLHQGRANDTTEELHHQMLFGIVRFGLLANDDRRKELLTDSRSFLFLQRGGDSRGILDRDNWEEFLGERGGFLFLIAHRDFGVLGLASTNQTGAPEAVAPGAVNCNETTEIHKFWFEEIR